MHVGYQVFCYNMIHFKYFLKVVSFLQRIPRNTSRRKFVAMALHCLKQLLFVDPLSQVRPAIKQRVTIVALLDRVLVH